MSSRATSPSRNHRFPPEIIGHGVWRYRRFSLSFREVEELSAERGVIVSYEAVRQWCLKFGQAFAKKLRHLIQQGFRLLQICRIKPFREPVVDRSEECVGLRCLVL